MTFAAHLTSSEFKESAKDALADIQLQSALHGIETGIVDRRRDVVAKLTEFDALRDSAKAIKNHTLAHLDLYLEQFEQRCTAAGGHVHYAVTADEARARVLDICRKADAKLVTKGKSMIGEEIAINDFLEQNGIVPVETDLGEYLVQIRHELPSHIIMPAVHLTQGQIEADFRRVHTHLAPDRNLVEPQTLLTEARVILRALKRYGMIVADNGSSWYISGVPDPRWDNDQLHTLHRLKGSDFRVVNTSKLRP